MRKINRDGMISFTNNNQNTPNASDENRSDGAMSMNRDHNAVRQLIKFSILYILIIVFSVG